VQVLLLFAAEYQAEGDGGIEVLDFEDGHFGFECNAKLIK
jgi:hypothetical protein